jgi:TRAP-type transport system small permease protein
LEGNKPYFIERAIHNVENVFIVLGVLLFLGLMFLDAFDVIGRYIFSRPIIGTMEISQILMAAMVLLTLGYTQAQKANIRIELVVAHYSPRIRAMIEYFILLIGLIIFALILWKSAVLAWADWKDHMLVEVIRIPLAPFKLFTTIGAFFICLEFIIQMTHLIPKMKAKAKTPVLPEQGSSGMSDGTEI